jgi:hypothetical protein
MLAGRPIHNVEVRQLNIQDFDEPFDVGIALHACGGATDISLQK